MPKKSLLIDVTLNFATFLCLVTSLGSIMKLTSIKLIVLFMYAFVFKG